MKRPGYREAVEWLASYDDCYWIGDKQPQLSVTASLVGELWDVPEPKLVDDIKRALKRIYPDHEALNA